MESIKNVFAKVWYGMRLPVYFMLFGLAWCMDRLKVGMSYLAYWFQEADIRLLRASFVVMPEKKEYYTNLLSKAYNEMLAAYASEKQ